MATDLAGMPLIPPPPSGSIAAEAAAQLAAHADEHGHLAALRGAFAHFPAALKALDNQYDLIIGQGRLDRSVRELIVACAASARGDEYLARAMAGQAAAHGFADADSAVAMAASGEGRSDAETCLLTWARKMGTTPYKVVEEDMARLHGAGWHDQEIVEALTVVSLSAYMSTMSLTLKLA